MPASLWNLCKKKKEEEEEEEENNGLQELSLDGNELSGHTRHRRRLLLPAPKAQPQQQPALGLHPCRSGDGGAIAGGARPQRQRAHGRHTCEPREAAEAVGAGPVEQQPERRHSCGAGELRGGLLRGERAPLRGAAGREAVR
jgi:hypothetical protein